MNNPTTRYIISIFVIGLGLYYAVIGLYVDFITYTAIGGGFIGIALNQEKRFPQYAKIINIATVIFILIGMFGLLYMFSIQDWKLK